MLRRAGAVAVRSASWLGANSPDFTSPNGGGTGEASESPLNQARRLFSGSRGLSHLTRQGDGARCLCDLGVPVCGASRRRQVVRGVSVQRWPMVGAVEGSSETCLQVVTMTLRQSGHAQGWAYRAPWCRRPRYEPDSRRARNGKHLSGARGRTLDSMEATSILSVTQAPARPLTSGPGHAWSTRASSVHSL